MFGADYAETIRSAFNQTHQRQFGYHDAAQPLELVSIRLAAIATPRIERSADAASCQATALAQPARGECFSNPKSIVRVLFHVIELAAGAQRHGPRDHPGIRQHDRPIPGKSSPRSRGPGS